MSRSRTLSNGDLFVISAPSGTGKTTLIRRLLAEIPGIDFSVSYTTRTIRPDEREGADYHFVDDDTFSRMVDTGAFLEWAQVHGRRYGTSAALVDTSLARGHDVLLDIDTQGAASVRSLRRNAVLIFILPPDRRTLEARLAGRGLETAEEVGRRLGNAREELEKYVNYDHMVINDDLGTALRELTAIVLSHRTRATRRRDACLSILASFQKT